MFPKSLLKDKNSDENNNISTLLCITFNILNGEVYFSENINCESVYWNKQIFEFDGFLNYNCGKAVGQSK